MNQDQMLARNANRAEAAKAMALLAQAAATIMVGHDDPEVRQIFDAASKMAIDLAREARD